MSEAAPDARGKPAEATDAAVMALVRASLAVWGIDAAVSRAGDGAFAISLADGARTLGIRRAPTGLPFRWLIALDSRERAASSVTGLLRVLHAALDPEWRPGRARISALSLGPP
jgi:hypothetical protein